MRRFCFTVVGAYLAVALLGHALERSGVAACDCREDCWCKRPGLNLFRWAFPFRHSRPCQRQPRREILRGAMSEENVEIVERAITAVNERDIDGYLACCTEDVQLQTPVSPVAGVYEGAVGIRRFFADIEDAGPDFRLNLERLEAVGGERVLAFVRVTSHGRASGLSTPAETGNVYEFEEGKIRRIEIFLDRGEALEAAGLSE